MISLDDYTGSSSVNLNPIYMSLNILSNQQQSIIDSLSTLSAPEYYITASSESTDKLSFCYNLNDDLSDLGLSNEYVNINMNGGDFKNNVVSNSALNLKFNLTGAGYISSNTFSGIDYCDLNGMGALSNEFGNVELLKGRVNLLSDNLISTNSLIDMTGITFNKNSIRSFHNLNLNYYGLNSLSLETGDVVNGVGISGISNYYYSIGCAKFNEQTNVSNSYYSISSQTITARVLSDNVFSYGTSIDLTCENINKNTISARTFNFNCVNFSNNSFEAPFSFMKGSGETMISNNFTQDINTMRLTFESITSNTFGNIVDCNIDALTFAKNGLDNSSIQTMNLTGDLISNNSFGNITKCNIDAGTFTLNSNTNGTITSFNLSGRLISYNSLKRFSSANINALTFERNSLSATSLDLKAISEANYNMIYGTTLNAMLKGRSNSLYATSCSFDGTLSSARMRAYSGSLTGFFSKNSLTFLNAKIDGTFRANVIMGSISDTDLIGTCTINNYYDIRTDTNTISCFGEVHINANRGNCLFSSISRLYIEDITPLDTFYQVETIVCHGLNNNTVASNFNGVYNLYSESLVDVPII